MNLTLTSVTLKTIPDFLFPQETYTQNFKAISQMVIKLLPILISVTLTLTSVTPNAIPDFLYPQGTYTQNFNSLSQTVLELLPGHGFSIFSNSDLDLDLSDPKSNPNLPLDMSNVHTKFEDKISKWTEVRERKPKS